ncbi:ABC transporter substrate-binding protein [Aquibacillus sp. 3ASR75-11]|uniref:ABC transporter substrate-binding protein n=1 Tax=Terrihalobacillus insolitus TaxID=2950438 RepID=A0A9X4ANF7_9BACI|nr:ABC transporter substrate-binding protein [Terrihalobacillus insolitus]MDC3424478.1 ABC transporter substrate-binding protein [Terrihalobacillus insolitus]
MDNMFRRIAVLLFLFIVTIGLVGCNTQEENKEESSQDQNSSAEVEEQEDGSQEESKLETEYPLTVTDATGTEVTFDSEPTKLVSLIPSDTEILFALGAGDEVLAVDDNSNYPEETADLPKLGSTYSGLNEEELIALQPDVVFINTQLQPEVAAQLRAKDIKVFGSNPQSIEEIMEAITRTGTILNNQEEAKAVTDQMNEDLQYVKDKLANVEPKKVYAEYSAGWSFGSGEFANDLINLAGGENIFADQESWFEVNPEEVIKRNPEVILYTSGEEGAGQENKEQILSRDGWDVIDAVKNERVVGVNSTKASRVGPRITESLIEIFEAIHPKLAE